MTTHEKFMPARRFLFASIAMPVLATVLVAIPGPARADRPYTVGFSTYLGGEAYDSARAVTTDGDGNIYVTGGTHSTNFPTTTRAYDRTFHTGGTTVGTAGSMMIFVTKFNPAGQRVWSTLLGGPNYDRAYAIRVDAQHNVYLAGRAGEGFPTTAGAIQRTFVRNTNISPNGLYGHQNGFVAKLSADGSRLLWATYFGDAGGAVNRDMDIDDQGNVYVCSNNQIIPSTYVTARAYQTTFRGGGKDGFVAKLNPTGTSVIWASYIGGSGPDGTTSIRVDGSYHVIVNGSTRSTDFPVTANAYQRTYGGGGDGFAARFLPDGSGLVFATYLGGAASDGAAGKHGLAVDRAGNSFHLGFTNSTDFPIPAGAFQISNHGGLSGTWEQSGDRWVLRLSADGNRAVGGSYLGGNARDGGEGIEIDAQQRVHLGGFTYSNDFPLTSSALKTSPSGIDDGTAVVFSSDFALLDFSTRFGSPGEDAFRALALDTMGNIILVGETPSTAFPLTNASQTSHAGGVMDVVVVKLCPASTSATESGVP